MVSLLSNDNLEGINSHIELRSRHANTASRNDNYWESYIVTPNHSTGVEIQIDLSGKNLEDLRTAWVRVHYTIYSQQDDKKKSSIALSLYSFLMLIKGNVGDQLLMLMYCQSEPIFYPQETILSK